MGVPEVSIIIVNYNTLPLTAACIDSVLDMTEDLSFEVILVDNASADGSREVFSRRTDITYIYSEENLGFGRANNLGYASSKGRHIFLLNSDTLLKNNAVKQLHDYLANAPAETGCAGCVLQDAEGRPIHSFGDFPTVRSAWQQTVASYFKCLQRPHNMPLPTDTYPKEVDYITGADLMIRRSVIEQYGLFDPAFFMYWEETELQRRYARHGIRRMVIEGPQIVHLVGASVGKQSQSLRSLLMSMESYYTYLRLACPRRERIALALLNLSVVPRLLCGRSPWADRKKLSSLILRKTAAALA